MFYKRLLLGVIFLVLCTFHGTTSLQLFQNGREYKYQYLGLFTTGTEQPVSHASTYRLQGMLTVQPLSPTTLAAKLDDMKIGLYNGRWSYFPIPDFEFLRDDRLETLEQPFKIELTEDGTFKSLTMNDQEPEFASNLKRGLATYLQMNLTNGFDKVQIFKDVELTTLGECPTNYEVTPITSSSVRVAKFRNHADCPDIPKRTRYGNKAFYACSSDKIRDTMNSTSYAVYDISFDDKETPTLDKITVLSSILYWPFTSSGQFLYTWYNLTLALDTTSTSVTSAIATPENSETHEDLAFVFEQSDYQDQEEETPDLKTVEPFYFHQTTADVEPETLEALVAKVKEVVTAIVARTEAHMDRMQEDFHSNSPMILSKLITHLDFDSLQQLYKHFHAKYKENPESPEFSMELQMFVDGLMLAGTSASSLVLRDIILETDCPKMLERILPTFHQYIRTPSELLAKEFDSLLPLLDKETLSPKIKGTLELSISNIISRTCERNLCVTSGILDKYITHFENKLTSSTSLEDQGLAVLCLMNLRHGKSLDKLLEIAVGNIPYNNSIRVPAIWSLKPLIYKNPVEMTRTLLKVFFNRKESCEIRTAVFGLITSTNPEERTLHEIAYYMWSETCPYTVNFVRSTLTLMAKSPSPCSEISSYAQTILKYLPPGAIDTTKTTAYALEYFDEENGLGRSIFATVQKSGKAALPVSVYLGSVGYIGGFATMPYGVFIRMEGLEKYSPLPIPAGDDLILQMDKMLKMLSSLNTTPRKRTPLKLELTVLYLDRAIYYFAADEKSLQASMIAALQKVSDLQRILRVNHDGSTSLVADVLYQQPLELGIPISIQTSGAALSVISNKMDIKPKEFSLEYYARFQQTFFMTTMISNHVPVLGLIHTAALTRTVGTNAPHHGRISRESDSSTIKIKHYPPEAENATAVQSHSTGCTMVSSESPIGTGHEDLLRKSCSSCSKHSLLSKGPGVAQSDELLSIPLGIDGMKGGLKKFNCERQISKSQMLKRFQAFYDDKGKNTGLFGSPWSKLFIGYMQMWDYIFLWPNPEPCGFTLYFGKSSDDPYALKEIDAEISFHNLTSGIFSMDEKVEYKYEGKNPPPSKFLDLKLKMSAAHHGSQNVQIRATKSGGKSGETWKTCVDVDNQAKFPETDILGFEGPNEPEVNQTVTVKVGKSGTEECANDYLDLTIFGEAERSLEQKAEAGVGGSGEWHYLFCQLERYTGKWPKGLIPPTGDCYKVVLDQTNLRSLNFTINYKVAKDLQKKLSRPYGFFGNLLSGYLVDPDQHKVHELKHAAHKHNHNSSSGQIEGEIEIDMNLRKQNPVMNVHWISGEEDEQHFHDFDLDLLPASLKTQPALSRFPHLSQLLFKNGFIGTCGITPEYVITFDSLNYGGKLPDCETIIAADCTDKPSFVVTAKSSNGKLKIGAQLREFYVEFSENGVTSPGITINYDADGMFLQTPLVFEKTPIYYSVKTLTLGVEVVYGVGGDYAKVILTSRHRGVTCGLCGNFDTFAANDLQGPVASVCPATSMIDAWTIKEGSCKSTPNQC